MEALLCSDSITNIREEQQEPSSPFNFNKDIHHLWSQDNVTRQLNSITHKVSELSFSRIIRKVSDCEHEADEQEQGDCFDPLFHHYTYSTPCKNLSSPSRGVKRRGGPAMNSNFSSTIVFSPCQRGRRSELLKSSLAKQTSQLKHQQPRKVARLSVAKHYPFDFPTIFATTGLPVIGTIAHPCFTPVKSDNRSSNNNPLPPSASPSLSPMTGIVDRNVRQLPTAFLTTEIDDFFNFGSFYQQQQKHDVKTVRARRVAISSTIKLPNIPELTE